MYYHIKINYFDPKIKAIQTRFSYDLTNKDDLKKILKFYIKGQPFIFEGVKLNSEDIRSVDIFESDHDINTCISIGDKELDSPLLFYNKSSIFEREELIRKITRPVFEDIESKHTQPLPSNQVSSRQTSNKLYSSKRVFIVHGHDSAVRTEVELTVSQLKLDPVVLFKQPDKGDTIIEKLERECSDVAFCIVLYTACDHGCEIDKEDYKPRARQNVVFEHGMMWGKLGRSRVVALVEEGVEIPGDLSGVIYQKIDKEGNWRFKLAREMKVAGLDVDANNIL